MSRRPKILLGVFSTIVVAMQFFRPAPNKSSASHSGDLMTQFRAPGEVKNVFEKACYDCHSNNTVYPWYANVQPFGWFLDRHIKRGKAVLNFNQFTDYSNRRRISKMKSIQNSLRDGTMPLSSYTWMHQNARLSGEEKKRLIDWTDRMIDSLEQ